ncbi:MAG: hypothetical protein RLZZ65_1670 [Bacteroidota bacterium]|jgi:hypothetical protein
MKKHLLFACTFFWLHGYFAQNTSAAFAPVKEQLESWDDIRGPWLAASIEALADKRAVPDRTFPEDYTPYEMLSMIPLRERQDLRQIIQENKFVVGNNSGAYPLFSTMLERTFCSRTYGRSYGDPHLKSFDRATYSFQTVGEFVLAKSLNAPFEVQTRQRAQDENFSLNEAVAMNVAGDRLCYYAADKPDGMQQPLRLNGMPIQLQGRSYYLPHGGVIRLDGRNYTIAWPTGETTVIDVRSGGLRGFVNVTVGIFECDRNQFEGLFGNNDGFADNDFNTRMNTPRPNNIAALSIASAYAFDNRQADQMSQYAEQEFQAYLAKNFAEEWRLTMQNTLFDYAPGMSTANYTDRSFPRVHMNISQMNPQSREAARQRCLQMGVPADEMGGCIFDQGYLNIAPNVPPTPNIPTPGSTVLHKVPRPALNNNEHTFSEGKYPSNPKPQTISGKPTDPTSGKSPREPEVIPESRPRTPAPRPSAPEPREPRPSAPRPSVPAPSAPAPRPSAPAPSAPRPSAPQPTAPRSTPPPPPPAPKPSMPAPSTPKPSAPSVKIGKG